LPIKFIHLKNLLAIQRMRLKRNEAAQQGKTFYYVFDSTLLRWYTGVGIYRVFQKNGTPVLILR